MEHKDDTFTEHKDDTYTVNIDDIMSDSITMSSLDATTINSNYTFSNASYGNITINSSSLGATGSNSAWGYTNTNGTGLYVSTDASFDGDVKIKGVSILETLNKIERRLAILRPDPEKLEHFEALRKAYEHYKTLEALCEVPTPEEE